MSCFKHIKFNILVRIAVCTLVNFCCISAFQTLLEKKRTRPVRVYRFPEPFESPVPLHGPGHVPIVGVHEHVALQGDDVVHGGEPVLVQLERLQLLHRREAVVRVDVLGYSALSASRLCAP